jgi:hypothetical protein
LTNEEIIAIARSNEHKLIAYFQMSDAAFEASGGQTKKWWKVLDVPRPAGMVSNDAKTVKTLREIFIRHAFLWREGVAWMRALATQGKMICGACYQQNTRSGILALDTTTANRHGELPKHKKAVRAHDKAAQHRLVAAPALPGGGGRGLVLAARADDNSLSRSLLIGAFVAGGHGAAGVPPSSVPQLLRQSTLGLLAEQLSTGMPVKSTITGTELPKIVQLVKQRIKEEVRGVKVSLYIDGGSGDLAYGRKVMVVCASSLAWEYDLLLDVQVLEAHETGATNAAQIERVCLEYDISKDNVWYICADNASPNKTAVELLNARGFKIQYARCLPHCLNLVVKTFMGVLDAKFKFSTNLKRMRGLLTAGGGSARKLLAIEYGFTTSSIDFADTRWASMVKAVLYVANEQSKRDMELAAKRLRELAAEGNVEAAAAAAAVEVRQKIFNVLYEYVEALTEQQLADVRQDDGEAVEESLTKNRKELLKFFSSLTTFAAFQLVDIVFGGSKDDGVERLPTLFTITQGSPSYASALSSRTTGVVPDAASAARSLMRLLAALHQAPSKPDSEDGLEEGEEEEEQQEEEMEVDGSARRNAIDKLARVQRELRARLEAQTQAVIEKARGAEERLFKGDWDVMDFENVDVPKFQATQEAFYPKVEEVVLASLVTACKAVDASAGLVKLEECVRGLELSQRFNCNLQPATLDILNTDNKILEHIGCKDASLHLADQLCAGYKAYVTSWQRPGVQLEPRQVFAFWKDYASGPNDALAALGRVAMMRFSRPISSACCERIFSYLTHMDASDRQTMGKETLARLLFLRGNWRLVHQMLDEMHAAIVGARQSRAGEGKRRRAADAQDAGAAAQAAALAAAQAAAGGGGGAGGGGQ